MDDRTLDLLLLEGLSEPLAVEVAAVEGGPVAFVRHGEMGAVLRLSRCETCDDGTIAADINVYQVAEGSWQDAGGGGSDWSWPLGVVPAEDEDSDFCFGTPLREGGRICLIPRFGPSGASLRVQPEHKHDWDDWAIGSLGNAP